MKIALIQGHPDPRGERFGCALAHAYERGAVEAGHKVRKIHVARLDFPMLRTKEAWESAPPPPAILEAQEAMLWAEHLVIFYTLWLGAKPGSRSCARSAAAALRAAVP